MSQVSTHVLDTAAGRQQPGVAVALERLRRGGWARVADGVTDPAAHHHVPLLLCPSGDTSDRGS